MTTKISKLLRQLIIKFGFFHRSLRDAEAHPLTDNISNEFLIWEAYMQGFEKLLKELHEELSAPNIELIPPWTLESILELKNFCRKICLEILHDKPSHEKLNGYLSNFTTQLEYIDDSLRFANVFVSHKKSED